MASDKSSTASLRRQQWQEKLGEVDAKILEYVRRRGGAYEAEIAKELDMWRTTVFWALGGLMPGVWCGW